MEEQETIILGLFVVLLVVVILFFMLLRDYVELDKKYQDCLDRDKFIILNKTVYINKTIEVIPKELCNLKDNMTLAKNIHQNWIDNPNLYKQYNIGSPEWDKAWVDIYEKFLNATKICET